MRTLDCGHGRYAQYHDPHWNRNISDFLIGKAQKFTSWLKSVSDKLGDVEQLLKLIALAATALFLATNGNKVLSSLAGL